VEGRKEDLPNLYLSLRFFEAGSDGLSAKSLARGERAVKEQDLYDFGVVV
jgi:hypothetical protein